MGRPTPGPGSEVVVGDLACVSKDVHYTEIKCGSVRETERNTDLRPGGGAPGAPQARLDPPPRTAFAPQARLDPPPRTPLRRRLVSILHAGGERARRGLLPSARTAGCVVAFVIAELRAPSRSCTRCRCHAPRLPVLLARAASSASRVPSAWRPSRPRAAPPPPCTLAHASASASADRLSWATSRLQLGANLAADRTGRVFGVVSPVRVPCAVCCATRCGRTLLDFDAVPPRIDLE